MMYDVIYLKNNLNELEDKQAYVKWWAKRNELDLLLDKLNVNFEDIRDALDIKDDLYCIYIGQSKNRIISSYLKMQFFDLSSFRTSISSILTFSPNNAEVVNEFMDKLKVEIFFVDFPVKSVEAKNELDSSISSCLEKNLYILNFQKNYHPLAKNIKKTLSKIKKEAWKKEENKNLLNEKEISKKDDDAIDVFESNQKRNLIYFGAPGTGKSFNLNKDKGNFDYERVTFHPDYSYANFVGTYKPVPEGNEITYKYVPGPFMRSLVKALRNPSKPFLLIIEEINRANVAAVFGDVFQLLDRTDDNESEYPINTSEDMKKYLKEELKDIDYINDFDTIKLPQNLFIWATMNSADQGVFPMDTAFKRRWDFKYFGINQDEELINETHVVLNNEPIYWNKLRKQINDELLSYKVNEDKLMGPFFAFNEYMNKEIPTETFKDIFKNKIIMYLFEDAARSKRNDLFSGAKGDDKYVTYSKICDEFDTKGIEIFCDSIKDKFSTQDEE